MVAAELVCKPAGMPQDAQNLLFSAICDEHTGQVDILVSSMPDAKRQLFASQSA